MKATWTGIALCCLVIYYGIVHSLSNPMVLMNAHAVILVLGGTIAIAFLTYSPKRLAEVMDYILFGFLFRMKKTEVAVAKELIYCIDVFYRRAPSFSLREQPHPFLGDAVALLNKKVHTPQALQEALLTRRNSVKRKFIEDAKILNNIAKYPPHLGLLGAASGMIEMMSGLGVSGTDSIGAAMAVALSATLWGVGLNNFVFLPLSDNAMKAAEDDVYLRDIIIECIVMMRKGSTHDEVIKACLNRLSLTDCSEITTELRMIHGSTQSDYAA